MLKFYKQILLGLLALFIFIELLCLVLLSSFDLSKALGIKKEFQNIMYITSYNETITADTLVLGDSVGRQLYPSRLKANYATSNGAVMIDGNLTILRNARKKNPLIKTILYVITPQSLGLNYTHELTSSNYIKPFVSIYDFKTLNAQILNGMKRAPLSYLYLFNFGKFLPLDDVKLSDNYIDDFRMSDLSIEGLKRLLNYCNQENLELLLFSPPVPNIGTEKLRVINYLSQINQQEEIKAIMDKYLSSIIYFPRNQYKDDLHFKKSYLKTNRKQLRNRLLYNYKQTSI